MEGRNLGPGENDAAEMTASSPRSPQLTLPPQRAIFDVFQALQPRELQAAVSLEFSAGHRRENAARVGQSGQHFERTGEVQLGDARVEREDDVEGRIHWRAPGISVDLAMMRA